MSVTQQNIDNVGLLSEKPLRVYVPQPNLRYLEFSGLTATVLDYNCYFLTFNSEQTKVTNTNQLPWEQEKIITHTQNLLNSYQHWTGNLLLGTDGSPEEISQQLFDIPFAVVSHGTEPDPIFNYGNRKALEQWEVSWEEFTQMRSRESAEEVVQEERNRLLAETEAKGFSRFSGVRITSTGKRFYIEDGMIWNIIDGENKFCGQAAIYSRCRFL